MKQVDFKGADHLTKLNRDSKAYNKLIEPVPWTKVELHGFGFDEDNIHKPLREEEAALQRPYIRVHLTHYNQYLARKEST